MIHGMAALFHVPPNCYSGNRICMELSLFASFSAEKLWVVIMLSAVMIVMAWIDFTKLKVPNKITFPTIFAGWFYALVNGALNGADITMHLPLRYLGFSDFDMFNLTGAVGGAVQGLWHSVGLTFFGMALLIWLYAIGGVGGGDVKMQMAFGAWVAPIYGWNLGFDIVLWGFLVGAVVGGVISAIMIWWSGTFAQNKKNALSIVNDWVTSKSVQEVADKAADRKPKLQLLPYGVPLCIGYLAYVVWDWFSSAPPVI